MRKALTTITLILLVAYVIFATIALTGKPDSEVCKELHLEIQDSLEMSYITTCDVIELLAQDGINPIGRQLHEVNLHEMEKSLEKSPLIRNCECYKSINGHVMVKVECRRPILHVVTISGDNFYLDEEGEVIESISKAVYVPVATGHITRKFAQQNLLALAQHIDSNELWKKQIEQIHVTPHGTIELTPRIGNHVIVLGRPENYEQKLDNLKIFYKKGLNEVGWERYSCINLDYENQVIASKK